MKYKLIIGFIIVMLIITNIRVVYAEGPGASWTKYMKININSSTGTLTNYAVPINITYDSDMQTDFDDLRFYAEDDTTELDYWLEEKVDSQWAYVWVKVDTINSSIYMYYGNPSAASASNGENTFLFFDDFDDGTLDTTKWYEPWTNGDYEEANGYLRVTGGNSAWEAVGSKIQYYNGYSWRVRFNVTAETDKWSVGLDDRSNDGSSNDGDAADISYIRYYNSNKQYYSDAGDGTGESASRTSNFTSFRTGDFMLNSSGVMIYDNDMFVYNSSDSPDIDVGISFWVYGQTLSIYADWTFARNWTYPEPSYSVGSEQSNEGNDTTSPTITITSPTNTTYSSNVININVTLNENGDWCAYNFDNGTNYTLNNDSMTNWFTVNQTAISNGTTVHLFVYCNDTSGNMALNDSIWFTYETSSGTPYLIEYSFYNLTSFAEDGINHIVYDDVNNDGKKEYLFGTEAVNTGNDPELVLYDAETDTQTVIKSWTNYKRVIFINVLDFDNDGKNEIIFGLSGTVTKRGRLYIIELNESNNIVHELYADPSSLSDAHPKTRAWDDWDNDGYIEFFTGWCSNGNIGVLDCDNTSCSWNDEANYGVTAEHNLGYDWNGDGRTDIFYGVGYSSGGSTTITFRKGQINESNNLVNVSVINQTTIYSDASLSGSVGDLDGDGNQEFVIAFHYYGTSTWDIYAYEFNTSGDIIETYEIETGFNADRLFYTGEIDDHDGDGDYEYIVVYTYNNVLYTTIFNVDSSHNIDKKIVISKSGYKTSTSTAYKPQIPSFGQFPTGIATFDGDTDGVAVVINFTRPEITPHYPNATAGDSLQLEFTCFDTGTNSTPLTAYIEWHRNGTLYKSLNMTVSNATEYTTNISNTKLSGGEIWYAKVWCGDGYSNSTKYNSTSVIVVGKSSVFPPSPSTPTVMEQYPALILIPITILFYLLLSIAGSILSSEINMTRITTLAIMIMVTIAFVAIIFTI